MNINMNNLLNKYLEITTNENDKILIEKKKIYINDSSEYYGERYIVTSNKFNKRNLYILREVYSLKDNRLRYLYDKYTDVKLVKTIEKDENNQEQDIIVVECYREKTSLIGSIGNIIKINSDLQRENKKHSTKILKLILKPIKIKNKKDNENIAA